VSQLGLDFAVSGRERLMRMINGQPWRFRDDFPEWIEDNFTIWERFEREAHAIYNGGRRHYSARTIGEFLRHETALRSASDGEWKLNDHRWPDLARLYLMLFPERDGFFELRESPLRRVA
jgi:hypothetical protein